MLIPKIQQPEIGNVQGTRGFYRCSRRCSVWLRRLRAVIAAAPMPTVGLVSWWPADGNALDIAAGNNGTTHDGVTYAPGMVGQA